MTHELGGGGENFELVTLASLTVEKVQQIQGQQTALVTEKDITNPYTYMLCIYLYLFGIYLYSLYSLFFWESARTARRTWFIILKLSHVNKSELPAELIPLVGSATPLQYNPPSRFCRAPFLKNQTSRILLICLMKIAGGGGGEATKSAYGAEVFLQHF